MIPLTTGGHNSKLWLVTKPNDLPFIRYIYLIYTGTTDDTLRDTLVLYKCHPKLWRYNTVKRASLELRLLRCFNPNITECVGVTFPKYPTINASNGYVPAVTG